MDIVEGRVCSVESTVTFNEPGQLHYIAHWLLHFGMRVGTIPNLEEEEVDYIGEENA